MVIRTQVLDRAAFFTTFGGKVVEIKGKYPDNEFTITIHKIIAMYESLGGWVPHRKFCNERRRLKRQTRKLAGLPEHFTGDTDSHFTFADLARVTFTSSKKKQ